MKRQIIIDGTVDTKTFVSLVEREVGRARRYQFFVSLLIIDIWQFCAHAGTRMRSDLLAKVTHLIHEKLRDTDAITVYDDRMVLVMLSYSDKQAAAKVGRRLRKWLQDCFSGPEALPSLPIHIGVASYPSVISDIDGLFEHAMSCLAKTKSEGGRAKSEEQNRIGPAGRPGAKSEE